MHIDTVVYYRVTDPKLYTYGVEHPCSALENLTATTLRNIVGDLELDETLTSRDTVNAQLCIILDQATDPWGIKVNRVELKNILPPKDIQEAMETMVAARLLTDLLTGKENPCQELLSPSRSMLQPQLAVNAAEATVNLLTPTKKRCPHLGCALKWNAAEHSWDCPCHGSRFSEEGQRLDGPATGNLKK